MNPRKKRETIYWVVSAILAVLFIILLFSRDGFVGVLGIFIVVAFTSTRLVYSFGRTIPLVLSSRKIGAFLATFFFTVVFSATQGGITYVVCWVVTKEFAILRDFEVFLISLSILIPLVGGWISIRVKRKSDGEESWAEKLDFFE